MRIPGSVAIVTGGARGFGKAFTEELLKRGAKVCFADVNVADGLQTEQTFKQTYGEDKSMFVKCDITNDTDFTGLWKTALEKFKSVDIVVNNAGILNERQPQKTIEINLLGTMRGTDLAIKHMRKDQGGNGGLIINVASTGGLFPVFFMPAYAASKYGVVGYTRSWAANPLCKTYGLSFACLCPAFSDTNMLSDTLSEDPPLITYHENEEQVQGVIHGIGVNSVEDVSAALIELIEKEDNNGAVVTIEKSRGAVYRFTEHPHKL
ncbi:15-hydroxyprostaglandin dehydrogenase [NAD(+)]-like [Mercenaria mercenaria]|uniref:15-hydroxyprostaglandin dehydrogenase [NAD(+)]-like n=1 Tax=Mercenaria mercenaria TaxID=6596 RepID=UPI001E1E04AC|nr:15-hydroxyprostaglandin dehydrogenase [NAD(+)]-like [Mercenaria mercenaria]XP_045215961.1 15-hydroxyprostaglandin dehydrogenase [NAD(+)]-like [Mercenaria mercenaria]